MVTTKARSRALVCVAFGVLLGVMGAACGSAAQTAVTVWMSEYTDETRRLFEEGPASLKSKFEEEYPGVRLEFVWNSWDTLHSQLAFALASGSPPDVVQMAPEALPGLAEYLTPLDPENWAVEGFFSPAWERVTWNGERFGLPLLLDPETVIYDTAPLVAAGYHGRSLPRTWDEYREFVQSMTQVDGNPVVGTASSRLIDHRTWLALYWQAGGALLDGANRLAVDSEEGAKALRFIKELHAAVAPVEPLIGSGPALTQGSVASLFGGIPDLRLVEAYNPAKLTFIEIGEPLADVRQAAWVQVDFFAVPAAAKSPAWAMAVLEFFARPENLAVYAESVGYLPARRDALAHAPRLEGSPHYQRLVEVVEKYGRAAPLVPRGPLLDALISEALLNTVEREWEPETALAYVRQRYESWAQVGSASTIQGWGENQ